MIGRFELSARKERLNKLYRLPNCSTVVPGACITGFAFHLQNVKLLSREVISILVQSQAPQIAAGRHQPFTSLSTSIQLGLCHLVLPTSYPPLSVDKQVPLVFVNLLQK